MWTPKLINMKERIRMWRVAKSGKIISKKAHLLDIKEYFPRYDLTISILLNFKSWCSALWPPDFVFVRSRPQGGANNDCEMGSK